MSPNVQRESASDSELDKTIDQLNRTKLSSSSEYSSEYTSENENRPMKLPRKPELFQKTFKIIKPKHPLKLTEEKDKYGMRYYKDKANKIEVN